MNTINSTLKILGYYLKTYYYMGSVLTCMSFGNTVHHFQVSYTVT